MANIEIRRVETRRDLGRFIDLHYDLYKDDPHDAPALFLDEMSTLRKDKNAAFEFCEAEYYLAYMDGQLVGRTAAIINHKANEKWGQKRVRFGWIDFIDNDDVARALLDAVADYGRANGMDEIVGPLGFTDLDPEGMLSEGYDHIGTMPTIYNFPYYVDIMRRFGGWEVDNRYVEYKIPIPKEIPEKYAKIARLVETRYNIHARKLTRRDVFEGGYGQKIFSVVNDTYKDLYGYSGLTPRQIDQYIRTYLKFIDLDFVTVIEDGNAGGKLCGVGISIPALAGAMRKCRRGRLLPFGWWHIWRAIRWHKTPSVDLLLIGVLPEYRSRGVNALIITDLIPRYQRAGFLFGETQVEMETNLHVQSQWTAANPTLHKRRICWSKKL